MSPRDYYEVLGVPRSATPEQVRSAYRRLARKYHPDVNKAKDAAERFKEATAAYDVLSDPEKRKMYDQFGHAGAGPAGFGGRPGGAGRTYTWTYGPGRQGPVGGVDFEEVFASSPFSGMSLQELMEALGGGGRRAGRRRAAAQAPPEMDLEYPVTLEFMQAVQGARIPLQLRRPDGSTERIEVKVPAGVHDGSRIRIPGKGQAGPDGPGHLYLLCRVREHPYFRRDGADLYVDLPVSVTEAALGAQVQVPTIDGPATLRIPPGASGGTHLRLRGKGVPDPKTGLRGDQYAVVKIVLPRDLSQRGRQLLEEFARTDPYDPREKAPW